MNTKRKWHSLFLIIAFLLAIWLPLIFSDKQGGKVSNVENRYLATFPKLYRSNGSFNFNVLKDFDSWIDDNSGGREQFAKINELLSYKIFDEFPLKSRNVVCGKNGWLYLMPQSEISKYQNYDALSQNQIDAYQTKLTNMTRYLNSLGIDYFMEIVPEKSAIYAENMPDTIQKSPLKMMPSQVLANAFKKENAFNFTTLYDALEQAKKTRQGLYYRAYDTTHWNDLGAFVGYQQTMKQVQKYFPDIKVLNRETLNFTPETKTLTLPGYSSSEIDYKIEPKNGWHTVADKSWFNRIVFHSKDDTRNYYYYKNSDSSLPKVLIVGDSFTWKFNLPLLAESFSQLVFIHYADMSNFQFLLDKFSPNLVIECGREGSLDSMLYFNVPTSVSSPVEGLPQKAPKKMTFALDAVNGQQVKSMQMRVDAKKETIDFSGWAVDELTQKPAKAVYIKVGNKFIKTVYGGSKASVAEYFHNQGLMNSVFTANLNTQNVLEAGGFSVYVVSHDGSYCYTPIEWTITAK